MITEMLHHLIVVVTPTEYGVEAIEEYLSTTDAEEYPSMEGEDLKIDPNLT